MQTAIIGSWQSNLIKNCTEPNHLIQESTPKEMTNSLPKFIFMSLLLMGGHVSADVDLLEEIRDLRLQGSLDDARLLAVRELETGAPDHQLAIELHLELARIFDRVGLHTNTRPVAAALVHIEAAQSLLEPANLAGGAAVELGLANYHYRAEMADREFQVANTHVRRAITLYSQLADKSGEADAVHLLGLIKLQSGNLQEARALFEESLTLDKAGANRVWFRGEYERHVGYVLQRSGDRIAAIPYFKRSLEARLEAGAIDASMFAALTLAESQFVLGDLSDAQINAEYALTVGEKINSPAGKARATDLIGRVKEREKGDQDESN
jgi:tetratricopeptide (TPR) repeat protein